MDIKEALIGASTDILAMFGMDLVYQHESEHEMLASASPVSILIGLTASLRGNVILGLKKTTALKIISGMMGGGEVAELDQIGKSALAEFANMVLGNAAARMNVAGAIDYTPPTLITGKQLFLVISKVRSYLLTFRLNQETYEVSFSIE